MKRALAILLAVITVLLCACGSGATEPETTAAPTVPTTEATTEPTVPAEDILAEAEALLFPGSLEIIPDGEAAMVLALPLAEDGNPHAQYLVGYIYDYAVDFEQDYEEARKWYTLAADQGYPRAMVALFFIYYYGQGVEADEEKAQELVQHALNLGYVEANYALGSLYEGNGEYKKALACFFASLEGSDPEFVRSCLLDIGCFYHWGYEAYDYDESWGYGAVPDYEKAMDYYQQAVDLGEAGAACNISDLYANGLGVEEDDEESIRWLEIGAEQGDACALFHRGVSYMLGTDGVKQNYQNAMEFFLNSVNANGDGSSYSMFWIGMLYENGKGVGQNYQAAMDWYQKSYAAGYEVAAYEIGYLYEEGLGVEQNYQTATDWYKKAQGARNAEWAEEVEKALARMKSKGYS